ncbi:MAG: winged helix-turn-helix domain-containing protein, partial [Pyrinomonadaceae bacterium]|nr:winged helix-turn-helix domain-containing protein [Pyrinomonadaceae bacterium]
LRIKTHLLLTEFNRGGVLQNMLLRYVNSLIAQVSQTAACNRLHTVEERLARWLLMTRDRTHGDELPLTHEFIAQMLGTRRAGVTGAAIALQTEGFIRYSRGNITIIDRAGLEGFACECYKIVKKEFDRALGNRN